MTFRSGTSRNSKTRATTREGLLKKCRNKVITEDDMERVAGLLRSSKQELQKDQRCLGMFEDKLGRAQVNSPRERTENTQGTAALYPVEFPRRANASPVRTTAREEANTDKKVRSMLISKTNLGSLKQLLASARRFLTRNHCHLEVLEEQLKRAEVVAHDQIPPDVITLNSQVRIHDLNVGRYTVYTLVFPDNADVARNRISVLAPVGSALLGCRVGDLIECEAPGVVRRMRVKEIVYQPEAAKCVS
jgi:regulator of nucleoside diphosphate kinase